MAKIQNNVQNKRKIKKFFRYLPVCLVFFSIITLVFLHFLNVLPFNYFLLITLVFLLFDAFMFYLILGHGWKKRLLGTILSFAKMIAMFVILLFSFNTFDFLDKIKSDNYNTENYSVIVLKGSSFDKIKTLNHQTIGILKSEEDQGLVLAKEHLEKKVTGDYIEKEDLDGLVDALISKKVEAILLEDSEKSILEEEHEAFLNLEKVVYQFSLDIPIQDDLVKQVDITSHPFNVFISGIDSYGKISSVSRSDVNMVLTINPTTHKVLVTSIPRDYYVKLHGIATEYKDKLTHAGIHGIDTSVKTVEDLLEIDINYYVKINFTSLVTLVDKLGGIDVTLDKPFRAFYNEDGTLVNYSFKKGNNHLNGKQALAFARERKSLARGDVARAEHQQLIIEGLFNKILSKNIITKYSDLLNALEGKFVTNMGTQNITTLVKYQIKTNPSWSIEKNTLVGIDSSQYTYSYKRKKSYVMEPDMKSLDYAKNLIRSLAQS